MILLSQAESAHGGRGLLLQYQDTTFTATIGGTDLVHQLPENEDYWTNWILTVDAETKQAELYKDIGSLSNRRRTSNHLITSVPGNYIGDGKIYIGIHPHELDNAFVGSVGEVLVFDRHITGVDLLTLSESTLATKVRFSFTGVVDPDVDYFGVNFLPPSETISQRKYPWPTQTLSCKTYRTKHLTEPRCSLDTLDCAYCAWIMFALEGSESCSDAGACTEEDLQSCLACSDGVFVREKLQILYLINLVDVIIQGVSLIVAVLWLWQITECCASVCGCHAFMGPLALRLLLVATIILWLMDIGLDSAEIFIATEAQHPLQRIRDASCVYAPDQEEYLSDLRLGLDSIAILGGVQLAVSLIELFIVIAGNTAMIQTNHAAAHRIPSPNEVAVLRMEVFLAFVQLGMGIVDFSVLTAGLNADLAALFTEIQMSESGWCLSRDDNCL